VNFVQAALEVRTEMLGALHLKGLLFYAFEQERKHAEILKNLLSLDSSVYVASRLLVYSPLHNYPYVRLKIPSSNRTNTLDILFMRPFYISL
jgi:hypothetical protein